MALVPADARAPFLNAQGDGVRGEAFWSKLRPGSSFAVYYADDPGVWHERIALWPAVGKTRLHTWWILTPDAARYPEDLRASATNDGP